MKKNIKTSEPVCIGYYTNTPMQYSVVFHGCKMMESCDIFLIFAQNIDRGHS